MITILTILMIYYKTICNLVSYYIPVVSSSTKYVKNKINIIKK